ncbi:MAG: helix-turn-helix domain-containing protein [Chloroflexi bacterium]|nr:helix-turn-helix domain-containing protein [Chloroflexota bacterium]
MSSPSYTEDAGGKLTIQPDAVYSRKEASQALGVSLSTLKKLIDQGYLQVSQPPGMRRVFIKGSSILSMLDQTVVNSEAPRQAS